MALPRVGSEAAIKGWLGPLAAPHDFLLDGTLVEIKTSFPGSHDVTIASLQQLDDGGEPLYMGAVTLAPSTSTTPDAFTAAMLVAEIRQSIESSQTASTEFELRLAETGYADDEEYARAWYHISGVRYFRIRDDFPRLVPAGVPLGIGEVTYVIDLRSCSPFEVTFPGRQG
jgi:hypothetical protein